MNFKLPYALNNAIRRGVIKPLTDSAISIAKDAIIKSTVYSVDLSGNMFDFIRCGIMHKIFKHIPYAEYRDLFNHDDTCYDDDYDESSEFTDTGRPSRHSIPNCIANDIIMYKNTPIIAEIDLRMNDNGHRKRTFKLYTLSTKDNNANLDEFVVRFTELAKSMIRTQSRYSTATTLYRGMRAIHLGTHFKLRTFNDVFLPKTQKNAILSSVSSYINKREWYTKNNIPNHFGILLYGAPGTGKTSVAQAIAKYINAGELCVLTADGLHGINGVMDSMSRHRVLDKSIYRVVVIEDIDCSASACDRRHRLTSFVEEGDDWHSESEPIVSYGTGLSTILNAFDGIGAPSNIIYIFTTNHIEKLDPALIRPGRIDLCVEIPTVNAETLSEFCKQHYGKPLPDLSIEIKDGVTFGSLQVEVMKGVSMEDLVNSIRK